MKRLIMPAVIGLVLGLGIGVGVAFLRRPAPVAADEHAAATADSLAHADKPVAHDSAAAHAVPPMDSATQAHSAAPQSAPADSAAAQTHATAPASTQTPAATPPNAPAPVDPIKLTESLDTVAARLARIVGALKPEEAALVVAQLDDASARRVLLQLPERKAGLILAALPQERIAGLARALMLPKGSQRSTSRRCSAPRRFCRLPALPSRSHRFPARRRPCSALC
jgi:hypothetical protein